MQGIIVYNSQYKFLGALASNCKGFFIFRVFRRWLYGLDLESSVHWFESSYPDLFPYRLTAGFGALNTKMVWFESTWGNINGGFSLTGKMLHCE